VFDMHGKSYEILLEMVGNGGSCNYLKSDLLRLWLYGIYRALLWICRALLRVCRALV